MLRHMSALAARGDKEHSISSSPPLFSDFWRASVPLIRFTCRLRNITTGEELENFTDSRSCSATSLRRSANLRKPTSKARYPLPFKVVCESWLSTFPRSLGGELCVQSFFSSRHRSEEECFSQYFVHVVSETTQYGTRFCSRETIVKFA